MHIASESTAKPERSSSLSEGSALTSELLLEIAGRAQSFTAATGVAIALAQGDEMVCRASCGSSVPEPGSKLRTEGSFTGLCVSSGETMRCQDARSDPRVNAAACQALGIRSMVVVPLRGQRKVAGVLAVFSKTAQAFSGTHVSILQTLGEVIEALLREGGSLPDGAQMQPPSPMRLAEALRRAAEEDAPANTTAVVRDVREDSHSDRAVAAFHSKSPVEKMVIHPSPPVAAPPWPVPTQRAMPVEPIHEPSLPVEPVEAGHELVVPVAEAVEPIYHEYGARASSKAAGEDQQVLVVSGKGKPESPGSMLPVGAVLVAAAVLAVGGWVLYAKKSNGTEASASAPTSQPAASVETAVPTNPAERQPALAPMQPVAPRTSATPAAAATKAKPVREAGPEPDPPDVAPVVVVNELPKGLRGPAKNGAEAPEAPTLTVADISLPALSRPISMPVAGPQASKLVPAKLVHRVLPQYPEIAKRLRLEGMVVLHAVVTPEGRVSDVTVVSGNTLLHNAALAAVKQWRYSPSSLNGNPVESAVEIRLTFQHPK